jgi:uncharacterized membrane protein YdjX (TVP38/TMEM64 family)
VAIAAQLLAGLDAYKSGDFAAAAAIWDSVAQSCPQPAECDLALALAGLAGALRARRDGEIDLARLRYAEAEACLSGLPDAVLGVDVLALRADLARGLEVSGRRHPQVRPYQRFPLGATVRFLSLLGLLAVGAALLRFTPLGHLLERHRLVAFFLGLRDSSWAPLVLIGLYILAGPIGLPMTPLIIAGGIVFGSLQGAAYNTLGCVLGAAISYGLARLLGRDFVRRVAGKRLKRIETLLRRHGFWSMVGVRFLPVPFPVVNFGAALAGVKFGRFILTSTLGIAPAMLIYTYFAASLFDMWQGGDRSKLGKIGLAFLGVVAISLAPTIWQQLRRRQRYRQLVVERHARRTRPGVTAG